MKNEKPFSRKDFLKTAGGSAVFAAVCLACGGCNTTDSGGGNPNPPPSPNPSDPNSGVSVSGNTITIDLTKNDVATLRNAGGWMLITQATTLVLNVDGTNFRAMTSVCTHEGTTNLWSFSNSEFTCNNHGSKFNSSGEWVSGIDGDTGDLTQYAVQRSGDTVTITKT